MKSGPLQLEHVISVVVVTGSADTVKVALGWVPCFMCVYMTDYS